jgi:iron(III) transport system ATP-binding protein
LRIPLKILYFVSSFDDVILNKLNLRDSVVFGMPQPTILQLETVTKQFPRTAMPAVKQISLVLTQGEILSLLGPSGCGKTTLLRLIAGFERPDRGTIQIANETVAASDRWQPPERRDVGMVFQDYALFPHLTVAKNVAFGLTRRSQPQQAHEQVKEAIALVGLTGYEQRYPHELSGGQQQRIALARALAPQPVLILLDEPLSNLDVQVRLRLRQEVRDILKQTGASALFVTHDQEEALCVSDQVAVMRDGCIEQFGTPEVIYQAPVSRFVADFVTQANFVPATLNGEVWKTEIGHFAAAESQKVISKKLSKVESEPLSLNAAPSSASLMIRLEDIVLEPDETSSVVIRDRQFLGRDYLYRLVCPSGQELRARIVATRALAVGTRVKVKVAESTIQVFVTEPSHCFS